MRKFTGDRAMTVGFVVLSFALALCQRPGQAMTDTKIDLHVDPVDFLEKVASLWTTTGDLGQVHSSQYSGYLWPMGPFFAALHAIGVSPWLAQRLWLGLIFAISAWGVLRLMDVVAGRPRGVAHVVAAAVYVVNPYTAVFAARATVVLLGYAALPWLLVVVSRGVRAVRDAGGWRDWRMWLAPAAFALILTSIGGGVNAAVVGWMLVGPLVLMIYEPLVGTVRWRDSAIFGLQVGLLGMLASLWWILPLLAHVSYGVDYLQFTEQPNSIWATNSTTEALRLMAYWTSYFGVGFYGAQRPLFSESATLLFNPFLVGASLLVPALAIAGLLWSRRFRYTPFLLLVLLVGLAIEVAGFPSGTPIRQGMEWVYNEIFVLRFMRTTQKAAPLVAIGIAGLLGLGFQLAWTRLRALPGPRARWLAPLGVSAALAGLIALAALPLTRGSTPDSQITWDRIPQPWLQAGRDLDRELPPNSRAMVLPGQIFAYYRWGGTVDAILPRLTDKPVVVRYETPYSDPHASDLLTTVDGLVQQKRLLPGQLEPLLGLMGVRAVITGSDDDISRGGALAASDAAVELAGQGLSRPARDYGPVRTVAPAKKEFGPGRPLPQVRRYDLPAGRGLVDVEPLDPATIVDGSAAGLAGLAAFGALPESTPIFYAGDLTAAQIRRQAARGTEVVITDSNRRRAFIPTNTQQNVGRTLRTDEPFNEDAALINPFPARGSDAETVAVLKGARSISAPEGGGPLAFPEKAAVAAFDGDSSTMWTDRFLRPDQRWLEIEFDRPRDVPYVDLLPIRDWRGVEKKVEVNGVRATLGRGYTRVPLDQRDVERVRVRLTEVDQSDAEPKGSGGFREIRIPGVRAHQMLRPPLLASAALAGRDLRRTALTYLFERTTGDQPRRRDRHTGSPLIELLPNRQDAEKQIDRLVFAPTARSYSVDAWVSPSVDARDPTFDRLAGLDSPFAFDSSSRFHNLPRHRASSAFDGRLDTSWVSIWEPPSAPDPWISWEGDAPMTVSRLTVTAPEQVVRRPTEVRVSGGGQTTPPLRVSAAGAVTLPRPIRARRLRLTVLKARFPADATRMERTTRAIGIASLEVPGLRPVNVPTDGPLRAGCGSVRMRAASKTVALRPRGSVRDLDAGRPLRAGSCAGPARLGDDVQRIGSLPGPFSVDLLRLSSPAPVPADRPAGGGKVVDPGKLGSSSLEGATVSLDGPSWLTLGQSYSKGWRATCDGRSLGASRPMNGYANGWRAPGDCRRVAFAFEPQDTARQGYVISAVVCLLLAAFLVAGWLASRGRERDSAAPPPLRDERAAGMALPRAAAIALALTIPLALLFALRTSVFISPVLTFILWRGVGARVLIAIAAALLGVVVPVLYAVVSPRDRGGYNFEYSVELIRAHWVGVLAFVLLGAACWRMVAAARSARPGRAQPAGRSISANRTARAE